MSVSGREVTKSVLWLGPFPPPVNGASLVTERMAEEAANHVRVIWVDLNAPKTARLRYHLGRVICHARAARVIWGARSTVRHMYFSLPGGFGLVYAIPLVLLSRCLRYNIFLHHHSFAYLSERRFDVRILLCFAGSGHRNIVLCAAMKHALAEHYPQARSIQVLSNAWVIPAELSGSKARNTRVIGHLSNLSTSKGIGTVIQVYEAMVKDEPSIELLIAGPFADPKSEALVTGALRRYPSITYLGPVYGVAKSEFFSKVDVFLFPSTYVNEAEPLVIDEALAAGCAVVCSSNGCMSEFNDRRAVNSLGAGSSIADYCEAVQMAFQVGTREASQQVHAHRSSTASASLDEFIRLLVA